MNGMASPDVVVVGGGPAGLAAAEALRDAGARVSLLDENPSLGGQFFKQYAAGLGIPRGRELDQRDAAIKQSVQRLIGPNLDVRAGCLVWGLSPHLEVGVYQDDRAELLKPDSVILAAGAIERPLAFPGWTLPGVVMAGGVQTLLRREAILPGSRFLLAGTGPFLLAVATQLVYAGAEVVAVVEASRVAASEEASTFYLSETIAAGRDEFPVLSGFAVQRVEQDGDAFRVAVVAVDDAGQAIAGEELAFQVDAVAVHAGFVPSLELARMAGCELDYSAERSGWYVAHDDGMRTSQPGVYAAGQLTGIGGALLAEATGRLAGLSAAIDLGLVEASRYAEEIGHLRQRIERGRLLAGQVNTTYRLKPGLAGPISPSTLVCRCEEVAAADVDLAIAQGARSLNDVKRYTRCGMGRCQGRICSSVLPLYLEHTAGIDPRTADLFTARPPLKPIPLRALSRLEISIEPNDVLTH